MSYRSPSKCPWPLPPCACVAVAARLPGSHVSLQVRACMCVCVRVHTHVSDLRTQSRHSFCNTYSDLAYNTPRPERLSPLHSLPSEATSPRTVTSAATVEPASTTGYLTLCWRRLSAHCAPVTVHTDPARTAGNLYPLVWSLHGPESCDDIGPISQMRN